MLKSFLITTTTITMLMSGGAYAQIGYGRSRFRKNNVPPSCYSVPQFDKLGNVIYWRLNCPLPINTPPFADAPWIIPGGNANGG